jgi:hypothetical protein
VDNGVLVDLVELLLVKKHPLLTGRGVEPVHDVVIRAAREQLGDLAPLVAHLFLCLENDRVLLLRPLPLLDARVEVVEVPLPALHSVPSWNLFRDVAPLNLLCGSVQLDNGLELGVLLLGPRSLAHFVAFCWSRGGGWSTRGTPFPLA